jgi:aspartate carbamoyltransferase regulatory subunit
MDNSTAFNLAFSKRGRKAQKSMTPEQIKHNAISDRMQKEKLYICEYCGLEVKKDGLQIALFHSSKPDWVLNNATGKMSCPNPECFTQAQAEQQQAKEKGAFHY